ncbi:MAG: BamA/TamA family outer membrane protein [Muribaculaceae bacterium]|nr:BamA/TamA family outer membrane protein [Muribaculaceae bacterium]
MAQNPVDSAQTVIESADTVPVKKKNFIQKIISYFDDANKPQKQSNKKFDFSVIGGPYYASDTKLGIGLVAAGQYRTSAADTINPSGQVNIYGDVAITGYFKLGVRGNQRFGERKGELSYDLSFESRPDHFWGIGYDKAHCDSNNTVYDLRRINLDMSYMMRVAPNFYMGPSLVVDWAMGKHIKRPELWNYQDSRIFTDGIGVSIMYDSRDNVFNAYHGIYARLDQTFSPKFLGNRYAFSATKFAFSWYHPLWKGCILATRLNARLTYGNTPWTMMSKLGGSYTMRGYWEGRYNDKCSADVTVELRQHIWHRNGLVVWGGFGEVFPRANKIFSSRLLPNYGIGYRWEFKKRVNVRVDYGFGHHQQGLVFSINEAF